MPTKSLDIIITGAQIIAMEAHNTSSDLIILSNENLN